jgi:hypothetical protein
MAFTAADLAAINAAIAAGEKTVRYGDRMVEYRTVDELLKAKADILTDINRADSAVSPRSRSIRVRSGGKGVW